MEWRSREVLAWTSGDGPGRPPRGPARLLTGSLAVTLGAAHVVMLSSDTLCPEHRDWVLGLGAVALVAAVVAIVGLVRGTASSALWTVLAAGCGVAIGVIDAAHVPARGQLIALVFAGVALVGACLGAWQVRLWWWERRTVRALEPLPAGRRHEPADHRVGRAQQDDTAAAGAGAGAKHLVKDLEKDSVTDPVTDPAAGPG